MPMSTSRIGRNVNDARYYLYCRRQSTVGPVPKDDGVTRKARRSEKRTANAIVAEELAGIDDELADRASHDRS